MNKAKNFGWLIVVLFLFSCKKNAWEIVQQTETSIPVTVANIYGTYRGVPTVATSVSAGGNVSITLTIPSGSGRTIKEISRVGIASITNNFKVVQTTSGLYNTAPISGNGTSVTFTTTLAEYTAKTGLGFLPAGTPTSFLARYFYFLITLDNGEQIIPMPVQVYVNT